MQFSRHSEYLHNPTLLKIELMLRGVQVEKGLLDELYGGVVDVEKGIDGIDIVLPRKTPASVPYREEFVATSPYHLQLKGGRTVISNGKGEVEVDVPPLPEFFKGRTSRGLPFFEVGTVQGNNVTVTPSKRCDFFRSDAACRYCTGNFEGEGGKARVYSVDEVLETVDAAHREGRAKVIYLSVGFGHEEDGGLNFLLPYIEGIKKHFKSLLVMESLPPVENRWIDEAYAAGIDSVNYNLEIFDGEIFALICPGRSSAVGKERYIEALRYASTVFPSGTVASHLIVGLEPPGSTVQGIDFLTELGVIPILPIYRPTPGGALRIEPLTTEVIAPVYAHLYEAIKKRGINMNWSKDISTITTPLEGRFLVDGGKGFTSLLHDFYNVRIEGLKATWGLSTLRRKLRVHGEGDSSD